MFRPKTLLAVLVALGLHYHALARAAEAQQPGLFDRENLVAWCIVPFDAARRGPEERAQMLADLGIRQLAYDWRAEHIPQFDAEVEALTRHGIRLTAWWIAPPDLGEVNRKILDVVRRHQLRLQFWVLVGDPPAELSQAEKVRLAAQQIRPFAEEAARLNCQVGLYNHGGWFGEPENQLAILEALGMEHVGLVYNLHHGHAHLDRLADLLAKMRPHLLALNLNGMTPRGDALGQKILPLGAGESDLEVLRTIHASGYRGPIGILNHTDLDARARLADNLAGLDWLVAQLQGLPAAPRPRMETYQWPAPAAGDPSNGAGVDRGDVNQLAEAAQAHGDPHRGAMVFASPRFACLSCHRVGELGGSVGPDLSRVGRSLRLDEIAESLLWPKRRVRAEYLATAIETSQGAVLQGYVTGQTHAELTVREATSNETRRLPLAEVVERHAVGTLMPEGLAAAMTPREQRDVVRFLSELGHGPHSAATDLLAHAHAPAAFDCPRAPLEPARWRDALHPVNRDRVYDYYAKQADHFRGQGHALLLPEFPGLDGGALGHWGNQNDDTWRDDRWNQTDLGSLICGVFHGPRGVVRRGVCVRIEGPAQLSACFDPETFSYPAVWRGEFVGFSPVRHGFLDGLAPRGEPVPFEGDALPAKDREYLGFYRSGSRVVFAYRIDGQLYLDAPREQEGRFARLAAPADQHPDRHVLAGGPGQWPQVLTTQGELGQGGPYVIDRVVAPRENPWRALMFFGGHDFFPDGTAAVATMQGDVWLVSGLDEKLDQVRWRRFASGLHHPQGVVVADGMIYVQGRNQITRLHDLNGDGEADFYECFSQAFETSPAGHDFVCGLERDPLGAFYTASGNQGLVRISPDGQQAQVLATGFRNPDGLGLLPDGWLTVPASEGEWTATSMICLVPPADPARDTSSGGGEEKTAPPHYGYGGPRGGEPPRRPLVYLPRGVDNSAGGQVFVASDRWGPARGLMAHFSYGAGTWFLVLRDQAQGSSQGAVVPMPGDFAAGPHRGRFNPRDGQLYVSGMAGWGTYTVADGCLDRVRYTGQRAQLPVSFQVHENGVRVTFSEPVDPAVAEQAEYQFAQAWNYRYGPQYGSPELVPSHPGLAGHERWAVTAATVLPDGKSVFYELPDLQPVNQLHLRLAVEPGSPLDLFATVHSLDQPWTALPGYRPVEKRVLPHPQLADLELLANPPPPNPWREPLADARPVALEAGKNLSFATRTLRARAGEPLALTFTNPDVVPHNWVLIAPGSLARVGEAVNRLVSDPSAASRQYVPDDQAVLAYTDITPGSGQSTIYFRAPSQPGHYPYLCSFPGHWMAMNGVLIVE